MKNNNFNMGKTNDFTSDELCLLSEKWKQILKSRNIKTIPEYIKINRKKAINRLSAKKCALKKNNKFRDMEKLIEKLILENQTLKNKLNELSKNNSLKLESENFKLFYFN